MNYGGAGEGEFRLLPHVLRSSEIAEGIQCVVKISTVAALAVFVRRTTICTQKKYQLKVAFIVIAFINQIGGSKRERGRQADRPDHTLNQIS